MLSNGHSNLCGKFFLQEIAPLSNHSINLYRPVQSFRRDVVQQPQPPSLDVCVCVFNYYMDNAHLNCIFYGGFPSMKTSIHNVYKIAIQ